MMATRRLFVYGTLKKGGELHSNLASENAAFVGKARIKGRLFRIKGESFPGAVPTDAEEYINGELYELSSPGETLKKIDEIEGVGEGLFRRKLVDTWFPDGKTRAWAYFYAKPLKARSRIVTGHFPVRHRRASR